MAEFVVAPTPSRAEPVRPHGWLNIGSIVAVKRFYDLRIRKFGDWC